MNEDAVDSSQIQGHTVLRQNNYQVKRMAYMFGEHEEDIPNPAKNNHIPNAMASSAVKAPTKENPSKAKRKCHNQCVVDSISQKQELRKMFLAEQLEVLKPFIEPQIADQLQAFRDVFWDDHRRNIIKEFIQALTFCWLLFNAFKKTYKLSTGIFSTNSRTITSYQSTLMAIRICCNTKLKPNPKAQIWIKSTQIKLSHIYKIKMETQDHIDLIKRTFIHPI